MRLYFEIELVEPRGWGIKLGGHQVHGVPYALRTCCMTHVSKNNRTIELRAAHASERSCLTA